ncbi:MAG: flagellin Hag [Bacteroidales bacterium]|nr:flagellin Hag [Bacteroidales bacterium]
MRINNNVMALNAHRQLGMNQAGAAKSMEKLSSGFRINRAGDDAAGLAISEKMRGQIRGLKQASRNAQDGISLIQTAEGALNETHSILQRMRELAVQASTDTNTFSDRKEIQKEINQLLEEIDRIASDTEFNTQKLLNGEFEDKVIHIGANEGQNMEITIANMGTENIGTEGERISSLFVEGVDSMEESSATGEGVLTQEGADKAITNINDAIEQVSAERSKLGAIQNRLEHTIANLGTSAENLQAAESRIRDLDMADEIMKFTKDNILQQAATAMLAQANMAPQSVLQLLG